MPTMYDMYPTIPALGSLPYEQQKLHQRLLDLYGEGESRQLTEANRVVFQNEVERLTIISAQALSMIERINSGRAAPTDTPKAVQGLLSVLSSGLDGLSAIVNNGTVMDGYRMAVENALDKAHDAYDATKTEIEKIADKTIGKVTGIAPWLVIIIALVLAVVIFAKR